MKHQDFVLGSIKNVDKDFTIPSCSLHMINIDDYVSFVQDIVVQICN